MVVFRFHVPVSVQIDPLERPHAEPKRFLVVSTDSQSVEARKEGTAVDSFSFSSSSSAAAAAAVVDDKKKIHASKRHDLAPSGFSNAANKKRKLAGKQGASVIAAKEELRAVEKELKMRQEVRSVDKLNVLPVCLSISELDMLAVTKLAGEIPLEAESSRIAKAIVRDEGTPKFSTIRDIVLEESMFMLFEEMMQSEKGVQVKKFQPKTYELQRTDAPANKWNRREKRYRMLVFQKKVEMSLALLEASNQYYVDDMPVVQFLVQAQVKLRT